MTQTVSFSEFNPVQLKFLATLKAFGEPVPNDVIELLVPLPFGQYIDLRRKCDTHNWIKQSEDGSLCISNHLPKDLVTKLDMLNSPDRIKEMLNAIDADNYREQIPAQAHIRLFEKIGEEKMSLKLAMELAIDLNKKGDIKTSGNLLKKIGQLLSHMEKTEILWKGFITTAIELSNQILAGGVSINHLPVILKKVIKEAKRSGNQRIWAMAHLQLGVCYWQENRHNEAIAFLSNGMEKVKALGDNDIQTQASPFIGLYYWILGRYQIAKGFFKTGVKTAEKNENHLPNSSLSATLLTYCYAFTGDFHRAIGSISYSRHCAIQWEDYMSASVYRAILGIILWITNEREEALYNLEGAQADAQAAGSDVGLWLSYFGLASLYLKDGNFEKGQLFLDKTFSAGNKLGVSYQVYHPFFLESLFLAEEAGCTFKNGWCFEDQFNRIMALPSLHLQGAALRLRAVKSMAKGMNDKEVLKDLEASEKLVRKCDDPTELAKTLIEKARFYLKRSEPEKSRQFANEAHYELSGYADIFFPDDLRFLLKRDARKPHTREKQNNSIEPFRWMIEELVSQPGPLDPDLLLSVVSRFFRAERSALFVFSIESGESPRLTSARNLSQATIFSDYFRNSLELVFKCFHGKKSVKVHIDAASPSVGGKAALAVLCLPLLHNKSVRAVLYFDNSYLKNRFDFIKFSELKQIESLLSSLVEKYLSTSPPADASAYTAPVQSQQIEFSNQTNFIVANRNLIRILKKVERLAESDSTILISGETGVGKELIAQSIHYNSQRNNQPYVIMDFSTIPETLVESELFGYEKGAFTGADRQKIGRVEQAHKGTLFIDEIGEIPLDLQLKLLRLLQEKTFVRVGGTKTIKSDFRLVTATNRNLGEEVAAGRFREDLYYRLNVLEVTIPPLRQRQEDILPLTRYFLSYYARKYNRALPVLDKKQEIKLTHYHWPGNVRELKNVTERMLLMTKNNRVEFDLTGQSPPPDSNPFSDTPTMDELQRRYISYLLEKTGGQVGGPGGAAKILDMNRSTVNYRIKKLGIR